MKDLSTKPLVTDTLPLLLTILLLLMLMLSGCASNKSKDDAEPIKAKDYPSLATETGQDEEHAFPTLDTVEYVIACMNRHGGQTLTTLYQCSCQFDQFSKLMTYDEYSQAVVFRNLKSMPGETGGVFRDPPQAKILRTKLFESENTAKKECGIKDKIAQQ